MTLPDYAAVEGRLIGNQIVESMFPKTRMRILGNNCLLEALPSRQVTDGGIFLLPENPTDKKQFWKVLAVGPGRTNKKGVLIPPDFAVGQTVITPLHFSHFTFDDQPNLKIVDCDHIEARFDDAATPDI